MDVPTVAAVREWTPTTINYGNLGYGLADPDPLADIAGQGAALFALITGRTYATIPAELEPLVRRAVAGLTYMQVVQSQPDYLETLADFDLIQSFSAGSYSETRRSAEDALKARMLVPWGWLNDLLKLLLTPEKADYWDEQFSGEHAPAWEVTEVDWTASGHMTRGDYHVPGPPGWGGW